MARDQTEKELENHIVKDFESHAGKFRFCS